MNKEENILSDTLKTVREIDDNIYNHILNIIANNNGISNEFVLACRSTTVYFALVAVFWLDEVYDESTLEEIELRLL